MNTVFFVGKIAPYFESLKNILLSKKYLILESSIPDEIDQAGKQVEKIVLIFSDFKYACDYLVKNNSSWGGFSMLKVLYLPATPKISPEVDKVLNQVGLKIFNAKEESNFINKIEEFLNEKSLIGSEDFELEFTVHSEKK